MSADFSGYIVPYHQPTYAGHTAVKSQISNLYFNTVKHSSGFLLHIKYNYIIIIIIINTYLKSLLKTLLKITL